MARPTKHFFEKKEFTMSENMTYTLKAIADTGNDGRSFAPVDLGRRKVYGALVERGLLRETKAGSGNYKLSAFGIRFARSLGA